MSPEDQQFRGLEELSDRWLLPCRGLKVSQIMVDYALTFSLEGRAAIVIENDATLADRPGGAPGAGTVELHPGRQDVGSALTLLVRPSIRQSHSRPARSG